MLSISSTIIFPIFLVLALASYSYRSIAQHNHPNSLILGLTHSRSVISENNPSAFDIVKIQTESIFNMVEPLREARDGYLMSLNVGTPSQIIQVYFDTGSDLIWVPCGNLSFNCIECDQYFRSKKLVVGAFSPTFSSSSLRDLCTSSFCTQIHNSDNSYDPCVMVGCPLNSLLKGTCLRPCPSFAYTYGGGIVIGTLTKDVLNVHGNNSNATRVMQYFHFGCVRSTFREPLGIAGFGRGTLSLPSHLRFLSKGFSHCFVSFKFSSNPNITSPLIIGDLAISSKESSQFTPLLSNPKHPNYYYIALEAINVGNMSKLEAPMNLKEIDTNGNGGVMIDSGTTYTHLPQPFYSKILLDIESIISYPRAIEQEQQTGFDLCYKTSCPSNNGSICMEDDELPSISFHFMHNVSLFLPKGNHFYAIGPPSNSAIVKCLLYQSMDDVDNGGPAAIFGSFQQQNIEVVYDLEKDRIGFKQMDCATSQGLND